MVKKKWFRLTLITSKHTGYFPIACLLSVKGVWKYETDSGAIIEKWKVIEAKEVEID